ncbi:thioredoxin family protein [Streptomyces sp. SCA3-4]|uniref:thioredoxin family protein n=1 Tax=Streptomyces sichuanensis TaxID=2871810 RepID=UPI001CE24E18|nr:thioredoxin family protein [Streptomyces sichuanensis]MCA6095512.1 thioredoxin family protein [Streptomyces sichuanensis]
MAVTPLTNLTEYEEATSRDRPVVVNFCATWAPRCRVITPVFERFSELPEFADTVDFCRVDLDEAFDVAQKAGVGPVPVFMVFHNGTRLSEVVAPHPEALRALVGWASTIGPAPPADGATPGRSPQ